ncbi:AAA-like domain-containing protein [Chitinophaga jiangningensis]|uniref:AAA-like domain-containing protein n=1 Tax=Chitinophaga jiangningensis TaxID=1419482 RepID=A0A1M7A4I3_9BACT|nr:ATP-binding protein [Chitinophaga jiangningensis]SHL37652.1 AAA-like domain-containing protein [Chitinophaga jiangningensis]
MSVVKTPGEVAAIAGYFFQYEIFATEIYNQLLDNNLEWVEFASSGAGKLDDVLLGTSEKVIAYQIKHIGSSNFSYLDFTQSDTESIFKGAFKGWQSIKAKYSDKTIDARFITTQSVSAHDSITAYSAKEKPSFEKFIANLWLPLQEGTYDTNTIPKVWQPVWNALIGMVNTTATELIAFVQAFNFVFNYRTDQFLYDTYTQAMRTAHISRIVTRIAQIVAQKGNVRYDRLKFLTEFGLKNQYETRFQHAFFVDERHYQPINTTLAQLDAIIQRKDKGYIALAGNAGSGKSTLLTKWLTDSPYKVLKYYAYSNLEMSYEYGYRGEAEYFLHDLLIQIRESGLSLQDRLPENDLLDLQRHLGEELKKLSYLDQKVFIIVDGLDHIGREQQVCHSLISVLPRSESIPSNIYFILGSRTIGQLCELNFDIQQHLTQTDSIVSISPFNKEQINDLASSYELQLSGELLDKLLQNTQGHPLFLRYAVEELKQAKASQFDEIIEGKDFSGDIYLEYQKFWEKHKTLDGFVHVLGLISRFRYPYFDTEIFSQFEINRADAARVNQVAEYYFFKSATVWQFFHNSFKEFLITESAKNPFNGQFDRRQDIRYHLEIANAIASSNGLYRFNVIYHWYKAEAFEKIIETVSQAFFRQQWFAFRQTAIIREDIKIAAQAATKQKSYPTIAACFFAALELDQRAANFPLGEHYDIFLSAGRMEIACSFVFDSAKLLVSQANALEFAQLLFDKGYQKLARELFDRATPVQLLLRSKKLSRRRYHHSSYTESNEVELLKTWANIASLFLPMSDIINRCKDIVVADEAFEEPDEPVESEIILSLKEFFLDRGAYRELGELESFAKQILDQDDLFDFYFQVVYHREVSVELKKKGLAFFDNWILDTNNSHLLSYALVYTFASDNPEKRQRAFELLETPEALKQRSSRVRPGGFSDYVFNYARLYYIIKKDFSVAPETIIPESDKPIENGFYRAFAQMGLAQAWFYHGYPTASMSFFESVDKLFRLFHHRHGDPLYDYEIAASKGDFVKQILQVAVRISPEVIQDLLVKLTEEWKNNGQYWGDQSIQEIVTWVTTQQLYPDWCKATLHSLEASLFDSGYLNERITAGAKQSRLWSWLGETEKAIATIDQLMSIALEMGPEDDRQVDQMVSWISKRQPLQVADSQYYFDRLPAMLKKVNSASHTPAEAILEATLDQGNAFAVFEHLLFNRLISLLDGSEVILRYLLKQNRTWSDLMIKLFARIIVTMDDANTTRRRFIRVFFETQPTEQQIADLVSEFKICAVAEVRASYLYEVYDLALKNNINTENIGLPVRPEPRDRVQNSIARLRLKDGRELSLEDVLKTVHSLDELVSLKEQQEQYSYFNWTDPLVQIIPTAPATKLSSFLDTLDLDTETKHIIRIARELAKYQQTALAEKLLKRMIATSPRCQWGDDYYAKGKSEAYEALLELVPGQTTRDMAFKDFADTLTNMGTKTRESIIADLDNIFALFAGVADKNMLYQEIKLYRDQLHLHDQPVHTLAIMGTHNDDDLVTSWLHFMITMPSEFDQIIFPLLIQGHQKFKKLISTILQRLYTEGFTLKFLRLLHGLATQTNDYTNFYADELSRLVNSKRVDLMLLASNLLFFNDIEPQRIAQSTDLPLSYKLELQPQLGLVDASRQAVEHISEEGYLKPTSDPLVYTQIVRYERKVLARLTGFSEYNIAYRIRAIGDDLQFPDWCASISEQELRNLYDSTLDVKISYNRPDVQKVYAGLTKVIMELTDLGLVELEDIIPLVPHFDPALYLINSVEQPASVKSILNESGSAPSADRKWAHEFDDNYINSVLLPYDGTRYILAETILLQGMSHGKAIEIREACIDVEVQIDKRLPHIFPCRTEALLRDYLDIDEAGIVIYNSVFSTFPKSHWLAINPLLAEDMELHFNGKAGNFRWDNDSGEAVVESIFWQLGDPANKSGHHDSEAGYGWRVLISEEGLKKIISLLEGKPLIHYRQVERHLEFHQSRYDTHIKESDKKATTSEFKLS